MASSVPAPSTHESTRSGSPDGPVSPWKNPSYPARTHWAEKPALEEKLKHWGQKIQAVAQKLAVIGNSPNRQERERIYHQMLGARDQLAEAVRRLPGEAGSIYKEDHELLVNAESAFERLFQRWDSLKA